MKFKLFLAGIILAFSFSASAASVDVSGLSKEQVEQINKIVQDKSTVSSKTREELSKWGELGKGVGEALLSAARELGVAANDFARTPLGMVTTGIVVYKIIGRDLLKIIVGSILFTLGWVFGLRLMRHAKGITYTYQSIPIFWGLLNVNKLVTKSSTREDKSEWIVGGIAVILVSNFIALMLFFG